MNATLASTTRLQRQCWLTPSFVQQLREINNEYFGQLNNAGEISPTSYRDLRTVSIGTIRQSGQSECIVQLADRNSWIFTVNLSQRDDMKRRLNNAGKTVTAERVFTSGDLKNFTFAQGEKEPGILDKDVEVYGKPKTIFVDNASYFFERFGRKEFYKQLFPRLLPESDFVLIG